MPGSQAAPAYSGEGDIRQRSLVTPQGTSADSRIKRMHPDGNIITVDVKRFHRAGVLLQLFSG